MSNVAGKSLKTSLVINTIDWYAYGCNQFKTLHGIRNQMVNPKKYDGPIETMTNLQYQQTICIFRGQCKYLSKTLYSHLSPLCMRVYIYGCVYIYYGCIYIYIYIYGYIYIYIYGYICICVYIYIWVYIYIYIWVVYIYIWVYMGVYIYIWVYIDIYGYTPFKSSLQCFRTMRL